MASVLTPLCVATCTAIENDLRRNLEIGAATSTITTEVSASSRVTSMRFGKGATRAHAPLAARQPSFPRLLGAGVAAQ